MVKAKENKSYWGQRWAKGNRWFQLWLLIVLALGGQILGQHIEEIYSADCVLCMFSFQLNKLIYILKLASCYTI